MIVRTLSLKEGPVVWRMSIFCFTRYFNQFNVPCQSRAKGEGPKSQEIGGERNLTSNATLSPPESFSHQDGQRCEPFYWFIPCAEQSHETVSVNQHF